jgi:uncharacterized membrane protein
MASLNDLKFYERWPEVERAVEPDEILWSNLGVPISLKVCYRILVVLIALLLILISFFLILWINTFSTNELAKIPSARCPQEVNRTTAF